jgi:hypothetical protein
MQYFPAGFAQVQDEDLRLPTKQDLLRHSYYGNFKLITSLQRISSSPRVHLGMKLVDESFRRLKHNRFIFL